MHYILSFLVKMLMQLGNIHHNPRPKLHETCAGFRHEKGWKHNPLKMGAWGMHVFVCKTHYLASK